MILFKPRLPKVLILIIGHCNPEFILDTADSIRYWNKSALVDFEVAFAIDADKSTAEIIEKRHEKVYFTNAKNGWGRGILKTCLNAFAHFSMSDYYSDMITIDSDSLCIGPFVDYFLNAKRPGIWFAGTIWPTPNCDYQYHHYLHSNLLMEYNLQMQPEMAAGPCMMWYSDCLTFLKSIGWLDPKYFEECYPYVHFPHDQISAHFRSLGLCEIADMGSIMELRWRESLPVRHSKFGMVPDVWPGISVIHPTASSQYSEELCRAYFRQCRIYPATAKSDSQSWGLFG